MAAATADATSAPSGPRTLPGGITKGGTTLLHNQKTSPVGPFLKQQNGGEAF